MIGWRVAGGSGDSVGPAGYEEGDEGREDGVQRQVGCGAGGNGERADQVPPASDLVPDIEVAFGDGLRQQDADQEEDMFDLQNRFRPPVPHPMPAVVVQQVVERREREKVQIRFLHSKFNSMSNIHHCLLFRKIKIGYQLGWTERHLERITG